MKHKLLIALLSFNVSFTQLHADSNGAQAAKEGIISFYHENYKEAEQFLAKASAQGDLDAHYYLGIMYLNGYGVSRDYQEAARLFTLAANQHHINSQIALGVLMIEGVGVPQNFKRAAILFTTAAKEGNTNAQEILGWIYKYGIGVTENYIVAYALWNCVAAQGSEWARYNRDLLLREMNDAELYKAQDLSLNLTLLWKTLERPSSTLGQPIIKQQRKKRS